MLGEDPENSRNKARLIRQRVISDLPKLQEKEKWLSDEWWFHVTLAEAYFGLGLYDDAVQWIQAGLKIQDTPYWEFETTARQSAAQAFFQSKQRNEAARVLGVLLRNSNADIDSILVGKVGLALSGAVPGIFEPLTIKGLYPDQGEPYDVRLVDGGVYDNQGSHGLLVHDCNVIIVSDAAGQLTADNSPPDSLLKATPAHAVRSVLVLMERIRHAGFADLKARLQSKLLRGLMFVHMKAGLCVEPIGWTGSQESYTPPRQTILTPRGVRRDVQQARAELHTDLDDFIDEADYLMACGYQMAAKNFEGLLASIEGLSSEGQKEEWEFDDVLALITSTSEMTAQDRQTLLNRLAQGAKVNTG